MKERLSTTINKRKVIKQMALTGGNARLAIKNAGIKKTQYYKWLQVDDAFKEDVMSVLFGIVQCSEDKILAQALAGNVAAWNKKLKSSTQKIAKLTCCKKEN